MSELRGELRQGGYPLVVETFPKKNYRPAAVTVTDGCGTYALSTTTRHSPAGASCGSVPGATAAVVQAQANSRRAFFFSVVDTTHSLLHERYSHSCLSRLVPLCM